MYGTMWFVRWSQPDGTLRDEPCLTAEAANNLRDSVISTGLVAYITQQTGTWQSDLVATAHRA
jgi:hypothetical protein